MQWHEAIAILREPVPAAKRQVLAERWQELPEDLRVDWQVVGRHFTHCGYTLGPAYCSFGCTHCYLPKNANKVPLPSLDNLKAQIDANARFLGRNGNLQITGGDVLDAYVRADKVDELIAILRYAAEKGVVPMVMTHGQRLLDDPALLERLVVEGGLRKFAVHIDITQGGRPGFPLRDLQNEADLHPLRQQFVDLIHAVRQKTGIQFFAAHTLTITERNLEDVAEVLAWLTAEPRRLDAFRMVSLQPEADVGRTTYSRAQATPEATWQRVEKAFGLALSKDNLWFGHPKCSHMVTVAVLFPEKRIVNLIPADPASRAYWSELLATFSGVGARGNNHLEANLRRLAIIARRPRILWRTLTYARHLMRQEKIGVFSLLRHLATRRFGILNLVQHNFMSTAEVESGSAETEARLAACSFRGAVERNGQWEAVPMCAMNALEREGLYQIEIGRNAKPAKPSPLQTAAGG